MNHALEKTLRGILTILSILIAVIVPACTLSMIGYCIWGCVVNMRGGDVNGQGVFGMGLGGVIGTALYIWIACAVVSNLKEKREEGKCVPYWS